MRDLKPATTLLEEGLSARAYPGAVVEAGRAAGAVWRHAVGGLTYDEHAPAAALDTIYDLASLTKVLCTTTLAMRALDAGTLTLDDPLS